MSLIKFDIGTLATIDEGRIGEAFSQALARCYADCKDRPKLGKDRTIALEAKIVPVTDDAGDLLECLVQFQVKDSLPVRASKVYHMNAGRGALFYNELSPDDARQLTIDGVDGPRAVPDAKVAVTLPAPARKDVSS